MSSKKTPASLKERYPHISWKDVAGAGNIYRHNYEDVLESILWHTVKQELPPLFTVIQQELLSYDTIKKPN